MREWFAAEHEDADETRAMLRRTAQSDGDELLSEHKAVRVGGSADSKAVALVEGGRLRGYAQAAWHRPVSVDKEGYWAVEVALDPAVRDGDDVVRGVRAVRRLLPPNDAVAVWSSAEYVSAGLLAAGYEESRRLLRLRRDLPVSEMIAMPSEVSVRSFNVGKHRDKEAWLSVNNAAFADHPENGALTTADLEERTGRSWFDPAGLIMAWKGEQLLGFCWTKMHDGVVGEIYIIGVHPDFRGRGLGRALLLAGMDYLHRRRSADQVILYLEATNEEALSLYEAVGFILDRVSRQFQPQAH